MEQLISNSPVPSSVIDDYFPESFRSNSPGDFDNDEEEEGDLVEVMSGKEVISLKNALSESKRKVRALEEDHTKSLVKILELQDQLDHEKSKVDNLEKQAMAASALSEKEKLDLMEQKEECERKIAELTVALLASRKTTATAIEAAPTFPPEATTTTFLTPLPTAAPFNWFSIPRFIFANNSNRTLVHLHGAQSTIVASAPASAPCATLNFKIERFGAEYLRFGFSPTLSFSGVLGNSHHGGSFCLNAKRGGFSAMQNNKNQEITTSGGGGGDSPKDGDIISIILNFPEKSVTYRLNGKNLGEKFFPKQIGGLLYPAISFSGIGHVVTVLQDFGGL